jgi:hypothetical protein
MNGHLAQVVTQCTCGLLQGNGVAGTSSLCVRVVPPANALTKHSNKKDNTSTADRVNIIRGTRGNRVIHWAWVIAYTPAAPSTQ